VEITIEKADGSTFSAEAGGDQRKSATVQVSELNLILYMQLLLPFTPRLLKLLFHGMLLLLIWWIQIVIDGYSAPLTAGNFAKLVR